MIANRAAKRYAKSFFLLTGEKKTTEKVYSEVNVIRKLLADNPDINNLLASPVYPEEKKLELVKELIGSGASEDLGTFIRFLAEKRRLSILEAVCLEFSALFDRKMGFLDLEVESPMALSESKRKEIIKLFSAKTGKKIRVHEKKDAAMLGGIRVKMDDTVYDGSVTHLLSRLSKKLKN